MPRTGRTARTIFSRPSTAASDKCGLAGVGGGGEPLQASGRQWCQRALQTFFQVFALLSSPGQQALPQDGRLHLHQHGKKIRIAP